MIEIYNEVFAVKLVYLLIQDVQAQIQHNCP